MAVPLRIRVSPVGPHVKDESSAAPLMVGPGSPGLVWRAQCEPADSPLIAVSSLVGGVVDGLHRSWSLAEGYHYDLDVQVPVEPVSEHATGTVTIHLEVHEAGGGWVNAGHDAGGFTWQLDLSHDPTETQLLKVSNVDLDRTGSAVPIDDVRVRLVETGGPFGFWPQQSTLRATQYVDGNYIGLAPIGAPFVGWDVPLRATVEGPVEYVDFFADGTLVEPGVVPTDGIAASTWVADGNATITAQARIGTAVVASTSQAVVPVDYLPSLAATDELVMAQGVGMTHNGNVSAWINQGTIGDTYAKPLTNDPTNEAFRGAAPRFHATNDDSLQSGGASAAYSFLSDGTDADYAVVFWADIDAGYIFDDYRPSNARFGRTIEWLAAGGLRIWTGDGVDTASLSIPNLEHQHPHVLHIRTAAAPPQMVVEVDGYEEYSGPDPNPPPGNPPSYQPNLGQIAGGAGNELNGSVGAQWGKASHSADATGIVAWLRREHSPEVWTSVRPTSNNFQVVQGSWLMTTSHLVDGPTRKDVWAMNWGVRRDIGSAVNIFTVGSVWEAALYVQGEGWSGGNHGYEEVTGATLTVGGVPLDLGVRAQGEGDVVFNQTSNLIQPVGLNTFATKELTRTFDRYTMTDRVRITITSDVTISLGYMGMLPAIRLGGGQITDTAQRSPLWAEEDCSVAPFPQVVSLTDHVRIFGKTSTVDLRARLVNAVAPTADNGRMPGFVFGSDPPDYNKWYWMVVDTITLLTSGTVIDVTTEYTFRQALAA